MRIRRRGSDGRQVIEIENIGKEVGKMLKKLSETSRREIEASARNLPVAFEREAKSFVTFALRVRSGDLRRSIEQISRNQGGGSVELGLSSNKIYSRIQHEGGTIPPHVIRPRNAKALFWPGARHPVKKVNHPGGFIPATKFLETPIRLVMGLWSQRILKKIAAGFGKR